MKLFRLAPVFLALATVAAEKPAPLPSSPILAQLEFATATNEVLATRTLGFEVRSTPFKKEPAISKSGVQRGHLLLGSGATNKLACLYDRAKGQLHLDLNRNGDLTDDPAGIFSTTTRSNASFQAFSNVRLPLQTGSGLHTFQMDLSFYSYDGSMVSYVNAGFRSFWQGKTTCQGKEWQVAVVETPWEGSGSSAGSFLVLRPWSDRSRLFNLVAGTADAVSFPTRLFWQSQSWRVSRHFESAGQGLEQCKVEFAAEQPRLGRLTLSGALLHRVILEDSKGYTLFLDTFDRAMQVPVGDYKVSEIWIKQDAAEAVETSGRHLLIKENAATNLVAGGPLTNSVSIDRRGKNLSLTYQMLGAGGGTFRLQNDDRSNPPEFAIFHGEKKVASGKFAYG